MKRHLFLTGPSGCGKTKIIRDALGPAMAAAGGFNTEAVYTGAGILSGVALLPAAAAAGVEGFNASCFLNYDGRTLSKDNEIIRTEGTRLLQEAVYYPYAVLDMIGGIDLLIPQYRAALEELLNSELPIIGAVMGPDITRRLEQTFHISDRFEMLSDNLLAQLAADPDTLVLDIGKTGFDAARRIASFWVKEYVLG